MIFPSYPPAGAPNNYITTTAAAVATAKGIAAHRSGGSPVKSLQQFHAGIVG